MNISFRRVLLLFMLVACSASVEAANYDVERITAAAPSVKRGQALNVTVLLKGQAPASGVLVLLTITDPITGNPVDGVLQNTSGSLAQVTVTIPAGKNNGSFSLATKPTSPIGAISITAFTFGKPEAADVTILP